MHAALPLPVQIYRARPKADSCTDIRGTPHSRSLYRYTVLAPADSCTDIPCAPQGRLLYGYTGDATLPFPVQIYRSPSLSLYRFTVLAPLLLYRYTGDAALPFPVPLYRARPHSPYTDLPCLHHSRSLYRCTVLALPLPVLLYRAMLALPLLYRYTGDAALPFPVPLYRARPPSPCIDIRGTPRSRSLYRYTVLALPLPVLLYRAMLALPLPVQIYGGRPAPCTVVLPLLYHMARAPFLAQSSYPLPVSAYGGRGHSSQLFSYTVHLDLCSCRVGSSD
ncbi:hypothetical protein HGRIS_013312 [Hohenbuehelia grisea]|uniref:Uncharacterized protein n=1 Tax=Hohenbuehelia grisea TaxID=104357 RepID=A0ABR3IVA4_9AGAR